MARRACRHWPAHAPIIPAGDLECLRAKWLRHLGRSKKVRADEVRDTSSALKPRGRPDRNEAVRLAGSLGSGGIRAAAWQRNASNANSAPNRQERLPGSAPAALAFQQPSLRKAFKPIIENSCAARSLLSLMEQIVKVGKLGCNFFRVFAPLGQSFSRAPAYQRIAQVAGSTPPAGVPAYWPPREPVIMPARPRFPRSHLRFAARPVKVI